MEENASQNNEKKKLIYWEGENLIVYDDRKDIKYILEELEKRDLDKIKNATTPKNADRGTQSSMPNMDLYINKLIASSLIEPKLSDSEIEKLKGRISILLQKAVMRLYGMDEEILENF